MPTPELTICWSITTKCNMSCYYCFSKHDHLNSSEDMTIQVKQAVFDRLKELQEKQSVRLVILGGEPTLYNELYELCHEAIPLCRKVVVVTNGTRPEVIEKLPNEISIDLSYHGQELEHFKKIIDRIRKTKFLQVLCVLDPNCIDRCIELYRWCLANSIPFEAIPLVDNDTELAALYPDSLIDEFSKTPVYYSSEVFPLSGNIFSHIDIYRKGRDKQWDIQSGFNLCHQTNIAIYTDGSVYPCCRTGRVNHRTNVFDKKCMRYQIPCNHPWCLENRGCLDMAGWRQDPDGFFPWNNKSVQS